MLKNMKEFSPIYSVLPAYLQNIIVIWIIVSGLLVIVVLGYYFLHNKKQSENMKKQEEIELARVFKDYATWLEDQYEIFVNKKENINQRLAAKGKYFSGQRYKDQSENVKQIIKSINDGFLIKQRKAEDFLRKRGEISFERYKNTELKRNLDNVTKMKRTVKNNVVDDVIKDLQKQNITGIDFKELMQLKEE